MKTKVSRHDPSNRNLAVPHARAAAAGCVRNTAFHFAARTIPRRGGLALLLALFMAVSARAQNPPQDLSKLSVED